MKYEDSINFKLGDIVTYKQEVDTPVGKMVSPSDMTCVYIVSSFFPDTYWNRREGKPGDSHKYELINMINNHKTSVCQYQICLASERIDSIIEKAEEYLITLKCIKNELCDTTKQTNS